MKQFKYNAETKSFGFINKLKDKFSKSDIYLCVSKSKGTPIYLTSKEIEEFIEPMDSGKFRKGSVFPNPKNEEDFVKILGGPFKDRKDADKLLKEIKDTKMITDLYYAFGK